MENNTAFFNLYIEKILNEVQELNKTKLLLQTQVAWNEKTIQEMTELQNTLQEANNNLAYKLKTATSEKKTKNSKHADAAEGDTF